MSTIEVFEPALCCATGICGPDVPQDLVTFSADSEWLRGQGGQVARFNLASEPSTFAANPIVVQFLHVAGSDALPLVQVDGVTVLTGRYPSRDELAKWAGLVPVAAGRTQLGVTQSSAGGCCGGTGCC